MLKLLILCLSLLLGLAFTGTASAHYCRYHPCYYKGNGYVEVTHRYNYESRYNRYCRYHRVDGRVIRECIYPR